MEYPVMRNYDYRCTDRLALTLSGDNVWVNDRIPLKRSKDVLEMRAADQVGFARRFQSAANRIFSVNEFDEAKTIVSSSSLFESKSIEKKGEEKKSCSVAADVRKE